jgi:cytoskeleton protein RodZ
MSDQLVMPPQPAAGTGGPSAGTLLRTAREANGLHIGALAVAMKVPVRKLEALEADRLNELPDAVFVRALAASVCRTLKIDPGPVLDKLPQSVTPQLARNERGINMPVGQSGFGLPRSLLAFVSRPTVLIVLALLLAAVAMVFFPETFSEDAGLPSLPGLSGQALAGGAAAVSSVTPTAAPPTAPDAGSALAHPAVVAVSEPSVNGALTVVAVPPAKVESIAPAAPALPASPAVAVAVAVASPPAPVTAGLVQFKARASAWIRVRDRNSVIVFEKTLAAGESAAASGELPLSVVVGNVAATDVLVRGQAFRLDELNQNNVARFEVK